MSAGWSYAFKLSKEDLAKCRPPGTARLINHESYGVDERRDKLQLVPQPSRSRADPLNWPKWRKYNVLFAVSAYALIANTMASIIASALPVMAFTLDPPVSFGKVSKLLAINVLTFGVSNILWVPLSNIFGRRPIFLAGTLITVLATMWCGLSTSFTSLYAARAIQGVGGGPADTVAPQILGEVFFVHQRGRAMAVYTFFLAGGSFVGQVCGGYIAERYGWRYLFWIMIPLCTFNFLNFLFLVPETLYDREEPLEATTAHPDREIDGDKSAEEPVSVAVETVTLDDEPFTYWQSLKIGVWRGNVISNFVRPWFTLRLPGLWVVMLQYGGLLGGAVTMGTVLPSFLAAPPYLWGENVGLSSLAGVIGVIIGVLMTYLVVDWVLTRRAKHESHGFTEPEARLPLLFPALFLAVTGLWTFGFCIDNPTPKAWVGACVGLAMLSAAIVQIPSIGFNYLIEAYAPVSSDCFVMTTVVRSVISFAWTYFVGDWVASKGAAEPFGIFGMLMAIFGLMTIPLWRWGKRMRIATARYIGLPVCY